VFIIIKVARASDTIRFNSLGLLGLSLERKIL